MIEVTELSKKFKTKLAVNNVHLYIEKGEIVGLLGPNGAGKSTTISIISSLVKPTTGDVRFLGESTLRNPKKLRSVLGVVPQDLALYEELTAYENLLFFAKVYQIPKKQLIDRVDDVLNIIGLAEKKNERAKNFSGGMKRRLNIGIALLHNPEFLIMDEPTVGIDPQSRHHILETVRSLNRNGNMGVLYTSHYMEEVEYLCDRIYIMDNGEIIAAGTKEELKSLLAQEETIVIQVESVEAGFTEALQSHPCIKKVSATEQEYTLIVPKTANVLKDVFSLAEHCLITITSVNIKTPTLEDVFLHLTGNKLRD